MNGFNKFVAAALCAAMVGVISSATEYGGDKTNGANQGIVLSEDKVYPDNTDNSENTEISAALRPALDDGSDSRS